jgi:hypothetical protein
VFAHYNPVVEATDIVVLDPCTLPRASLVGVVVAVRSSAVVPFCGLCAALLVLLGL